MTREPVKKPEWIAERLEAVPIVDWDRFVVGEVNDRQRVTVYGWIDRDDDEHADFVLVHFWPEAGVMDYTTSSEEFTEYLFHSWFDGPIDEHNECRRVEDAFRVENAIELSDQATLEVSAE